MRMIDATAGVCIGLCLAGVINILMGQRVAAVCCMIAATAMALMMGDKNG